MLLPKTKAELIERIEKIWEELDQAVAVLSQEQVTAAGPDGWTVKDHLTHLAGWERSLVALLEGRDRLAAMGLPDISIHRAVIEADEFTDVNGRLRALHVKLSPKEAQALLRQTHEEVRTALVRLTEADLQAPISRFHPGEAGAFQDRPLIDLIIDNTCNHASEHLSWIRERAVGSR
jgi:hypothetical protein